MEEKKSFWRSKTKIAAILVGLSAILGTIGGALNGSIDYVTAGRTLLIEIGVILGIFGIRDWPLINKAK